MLKGCQASAGMLLSLYIDESKHICFIFTSFTVKFHPQRISLLLKDGSKLPEKLHLTAASSGKSGDGLAALK